MSNLLSIQDLNTTVNHEPRMHDILVAEKLGYERPADIKELIERNKEELSNYGEVFRTARKTGKRGGRPGEDVWLNEGQALVICALSRTPKAAEVRKAIIEVFMAYRNGNLPALPSTITPKQKALLKQAMEKRCAIDNSIRGAMWGRFNNHFLISAYAELPANRFEEAMGYIPNIPSHGVERDSPEHIEFMIKNAKKVLEEYGLKIQGELFQQDAHIKAYLTKLHESVCRAKGISYMARGVDMKSNMGKTLMNKLMGDLDQVLADASTVTGHYVHKRNELVLQ